MEWYVYQNSDESLQVFIGVIILLSAIVLAVFSLYFWIQDLKSLKKEKIK